MTGDVTWDVLIWIVSVIIGTSVGAAGTAWWLSGRFARIDARMTDAVTKCRHDMRNEMQLFVNEGDDKISAELQYLRTRVDGYLNGIHKR